jgi:hypothetical protein
MFGKYYVNLLMQEVQLANISKFISYLTEKALVIYFKDQSVDVVYGSKCAYFNNHTECINTLCGENVKFFNAKGLIYTIVLRKVIRKATLNGVLCNDDQLY